MLVKYLVYEKNKTAGREVKAVCPTIRDAKRMLFFLKKIDPDKHFRIIPTVNFKPKTTKT